MSGRSELITRTLSGMIIGSAVLFITWWNPISFDAMCILGGFILAREWWALTKKRSRWFILLGALYIGSALASLIVLRNLAGVFETFFLFAIVWGGDIGAYFIGRKWGRHKIAPSISPGKSWEGLAGSVLFTTLVLIAGIGSKTNFTGTPDARTLFFGVGTLIIIAAVFSIVGLAGDLFESSLKRKAGVKDSGTLIPGHGGLFDRVDALLPCAILSSIPSLIILIGCAISGDCP